MSRQYTLVTSKSALRYAREERVLHQELPPLFARQLAGFLREDEEPLATLFVDREEILEERVPARALVLIPEGVLFLEEGEALLGDSRWGVKSVFYPYAQISAVGLGEALLAGRFSLYGAGNAPPCEIPVHAQDLERFQAVARQIAERVAAAAA
jgi:hypothetical protein